MATEHAATCDNQSTEDKRYFDVAEANRALPYVSRIVKDVKDTLSEVKQLRQTIETAPEDKQVDDLVRTYDAGVARLESLSDELTKAGVELKNAEMGLIDFPALVDGREVCLCWRLGEDNIVAWHETHAGFAGRQDVKTLDSHLAGK